MHYRNGKEAHNGDVVLQLDFGSGKIKGLGVLHGATPGSDYCNGEVAPILPREPGACLCDCLLVSDVEAMLGERGLDKRPEGK